MNPIRKSAVISFLEWLRTFKPNVRSLSSLDRDEFLALADEYESSSRRRPISQDDDWRRRAEWRATHYWFSQHKSEKEALDHWPE